MEDINSNFYKIHKVCAEWKEFDLNAQDIFVLSILEERIKGEGKEYTKMTGKHIANILNKKESTVAKSIKKLIEKGLIQRRYRYMNTRGELVRKGQKKGCGIAKKLVYFRVLKLKSMERTPFYKIPKILFHKGFRKVSLEAKLLYVKLLDKIGLSVRNGFIKNGVPYIKLIQNITMKEFGVSKNTVTKLFKQLEEIGLIGKKRMGRSGIIVTVKEIESVKPVKFAIKSVKFFSAKKVVTVHSPETVTTTYKFKDKTHMYKISYKNIDVNIYTRKEVVKKKGNISYSFLESQKTAFNLNTKKSYKTIGYYRVLCVSLLPKFKTFDLFLSTMKNSNTKKSLGGYLLQEQVEVKRLEKSKGKEKDKKVTEKPVFVKKVKTNTSYCVRVDKGMMKQIEEIQVIIMKTKRLKVSKKNIAFRIAKDGYEETLRLAKQLRYLKRQVDEIQSMMDLFNFYTEGRMDHVDKKLIAREINACGYNRVHLVAQSLKDLIYDEIREDVKFFVSMCRKGFKDRSGYTHKANNDSGINAKIEAVKNDALEKASMSVKGNCG